MGVLETRKIDKIIERFKKRRKHVIDVLYAESDGWRQDKIRCQLKEIEDCIDIATEIKDEEEWNID